jgi:hypothetical protein
VGHSAVSQEQCGDNDQASDGTCGGRERQDAEGATHGQRRRVHVN